MSGSGPSGSTGAPPAVARAGEREGSVRLTLALVAALAAVYLGVTAIGAAEAARGTRVLPLLDPLIDLVRGRGPGSMRWLLHRMFAIAGGVTVIATAVALAALARRPAARRDAMPVVLLAVAVIAATWGQVFLLNDRMALGAGLYLTGVLAAALLGLWCPMTSLEGFPVLALPGVRPLGGARSPRLTLARECALVFFLAVLALLLRAWALTELPSGFDLEMVKSMIQSRTLHGIGSFIDDGFLTAAPGLVHVLTQRVVYALVGTSLYAVRASALLWGLAAVPLFYWLVRRLAGVGPALAATTLFVASPEMLFWSRTENSFFAPVTVLALVAALLGLWLVERLSFRAGVVVALWMPVTRLFYVPGFVLFIYPVLLVAHALIFVRGAWRRAWVMLPTLAAGVALWFGSLSILYAARDGWQWRFVNPAMVYGDSAWRKHGEAGFREAGALDLLRLQAELILRQLGIVLHGVTVNGPVMFSHWFERNHFLPNHEMLLNVALTVTFLLGVGYLIGQLRDRRAAALLLWLGLGLLPGVMSNEPSGRRIAVVFAAVYAVSGVMIAATVRLVRQRAGLWPARMATGATGVLIVLVAWSGLVSHFSMHMGLMAHQAQVAFARPLFQASDAIFTDVEDKAWREAQLLGNLDRFLESLPCYEHVRPAGWLAVALHPACSFPEEVFSLVLPRPRVDALARAYRPHRVSYVSEQTPSGRERARLLRDLYPSALVGEVVGREGTMPMASVSVDMADIEAMHSPWLTSFPGDAIPLANILLADVALVPAPSGSVPSAGAAVAVEGGLVSERDQWARLRLAPPCDGARLTIDGEPADATTTIPLARGVHRLELTVRDPTTCTLPLRILMQAGEEPEKPLGKWSITSPAATTIAGVASPPVAVYPGYGPSHLFARVDGTPHAAGVDSRGRVSILVRESSEKWHVRTFDQDGRDRALSRPELSANPRHVSMIVRPDGTRIFGSEGGLLIADENGRAERRVPLPFAGRPAEIAAWHDNEVLVVVPDRRSVAVVNGAGELAAELREFDGGPGRFESPLAISAAHGSLLVIQEDGLALLFSQDPAAPWMPRFERAFPIAFAKFPAEVRGATFDGADRILVPDRAAPSPLAYTAAGTRMLAESADHDPMARGFGVVGGVATSGDWVYVLDQSQNTVWRVARRAVGAEQGTNSAAGRG